MKSRLWPGLGAGLLVASSWIATATQSPLMITNTGNTVVISWTGPVVAGNWVLEGSPELPSSSTWGAVIPNFDLTNGTIRQVGVLPSGSNRFFRLRRLDPVVSGLSGLWKLDEGAGQEGQEGSGTGVPLLMNNVAWTSGRVGSSALRFTDGIVSGASRCWVSNNNYTVLPGAGQPFSVSFWFSPEDWTPGWRGLAGTDANGFPGWHVALSTPAKGTNYLVFAGSPAGSLSITGRTLLLPKQWHELTVTYDGVSGALYLDRVQLASGTLALPIPAHSGPVYFGGGVGGFSSFVGRMDEIRTYTNSLSDERISLLGEWLFDEGSGAFCADSSGRENHGRLSDATPTTRISGRNGRGLDMRGSSLVVPNQDLLVLPPSGDPFGISFWLRPAELTTGRFGLMSAGIAGNGGLQMSLSIPGSGPPMLHLGSTNQGGTLDLNVPLSLAADIWAKLEVTFDGAITTVFWNGRKLQSSSGAIRSSRAPLILGSVPGLPNFPGAVDELRIYGRARGDTEVVPTALVMWETAFVNSVTNLPLRGFGPTGRALSYALVPTITPTNGAVTLAAGSSVATYTAGARKGPDAFTYTVSDGEFTSPPTIATVSVVEPHWLSPGGGSEQPLDGRTPARAWKAGASVELDAVWKTNNYFDCFFYGPGEYQTTGWKYRSRPTAFPGCKHVGSGSDGPGRTTLKLVNIWESWLEETIFSAFEGTHAVDGFEVHNLVLDCNAEQVPKYLYGEPVWMRIPLATTSRVENVTVGWANRTLPGRYFLNIGRASSLRVCAVKSGNSVTNCLAATNTSQVSVVNVGADADELLLHCERRGPGVTFYGVSEIEVQGASVSLPSAVNLSNGSESRLGPEYGIGLAVDQNPETVWASGPETEARLELPLAAGTPVTQLTLSWFCRNVPQKGQLGFASEFTIQARDESSGTFVNVPMVRHARSASGREVVTFGTDLVTNVVVTDRLAIVLAARESGIRYYGLREVTAHNGPSDVPFRVPTALNRYGNYSIMQAFDRDTSTEWSSGTQGAVGAIALNGSNLKFTGLKVVGFGTKAGREGFPMYLAPPFVGPLRYGNVLVDSCVFERPATNNTDGTTVIALSENGSATLTNAVIRRCVVSGMKRHFGSSKAITASHVEECHVTDCEMGFYSEPDLANNDVPGPAIIRSNVFANVDHGVYVATHPGAFARGIICANNEITLTGNQGWGFAICDTCYQGKSGTSGDVVVMNNIIRYPDWIPRPASVDGGLYASDTKHAVFGNNIVDIGTPSALRVRACPDGLIPAPLGDCEEFFPVPPSPTTPPCVEPLPPGYKRAWYNNRDAMGNLMPVRFSSNGADGLASQQQYPE